MISGISVTGVSDIKQIIDITFKPAVYLLIMSAALYFIIRTIISLLRYLHERRESRRMSRQMRRLVNESFVVSADEFLEDADKYENYVGVYVVYNKTRDMHYVGQATRTVDRLKNHLTGHGNGDVYADYKYGDEMYISVLPYDLSYGTLNDMEADFIEYFDACANGYNKTKGNHH